MLGTIDRGHVSRILRELAGENAAGLMTTIAELDEQFPDYGRLLEDLARMLQRVAVYQVVGAADLSDEFDEAELAELAESIAAEDVQLYYQIAVMGRRDLYLAPDPRSGVEMTLLRMLAFRPESSEGSRRGRGQQRAQLKVKTPAPGVREQKAAPQPSARAPHAAAAAEAWSKPDWSALIPKLGLKGLNRQLANNCAYSRREGDTVHFELDSRSESYLTRERQAALAEALSKYYGESLKVDIHIADAIVETPVQKERRKELERHADARAGLEADPNVKALKDMFGAELVPESVEPLGGESAENQE
jgi:DNA polymerase-3 subunit gamma/tau